MVGYKCKAIKLIEKKQFKLTTITVINLEIISTIKNETLSST